MAEENKDVVEEVTDVTEQSTDQPLEEVVENKVDESKFNSAGDDSVIKVDLNNPPSQSEKVEEEPAEEEKVDVVEEPEVKEEVVEEQTEE